MSIKVDQFINSRFTSNTFVLSKEGTKGVWVIDPGDISPVTEWMAVNGKNEVKGALLTHSHFDHIYGLNELFGIYSSCPVYVANEYGRLALYDSKKNGSRYTDAPFVLKEEANIRLMGDTLELWQGVSMYIINTIGHSPDSVCFLIDNLIFTGDTLIKGTRTVTKLKGGSALDLENSIDILRSEYQGMGLTVMPGHGNSFQLDGYDLSLATYNKLSDAIY